MTKAATDPVAGGSQGDGSDGSPDPSKSPSTGEEFVSKDRFDGLMSSFGKAQNEIKALKELVASLEQKPATPPAAPPPTDEVSPAVRQMIEEAKGESRTVYQTLKQREVAHLLEKYPLATAEAVKGTSPEQWEESIKREHERVSAIVANEREAAAKAREEELREEFGSPLGFDAGNRQPTAPTTAEEYKAALEKAQAAGDEALVARLILLNPAIGQ